MLGSQFELNKSTTRLNDQNVQTQQRYAELLGQQKLTEVQKTNISKLEALFGSTEKTVDIISKLAPKTAVDLIENIGNMFDPNGSNSRYHIKNKIQSMTEDQLLNFFEKHSKR